jgi:hypothetical protein
MNAGRAASLCGALALAAAACGAKEPERQHVRVDPGPESASVEDMSAQLPDLARALVPNEALADSVDEDDFAVEECGIQPVFPCVRAYFVTEDIALEERVELMRRQAASAGWKILSEGREHGVTLEIERGAYRAEYMLEPDDSDLCHLAPRCVIGTMLTVAGPPPPLPAPSDAERASWTGEKRAFVEEANAVCAETETRLREPDDVAPALADALEKLSALEPPSGEERRVERILRPLRILVKAAEALAEDEGEDALPAAVAVGEFAKRFNKAASRYGLDVCAQLG